MDVSTYVCTYYITFEYSQIEYIECIFHILYSIIPGFSASYIVQGLLSGIYQMQIFNHADKKIHNKIIIETIDYTDAQFIALILSSNFTNYYD